MPIEPRAMAYVTDRPPRHVFQHDAAPGTYRRNGWRPAGDASQQTRSDPAHLLMADELRLPARTRPPLCECRRDGSKADDQVVFRSQLPADIDALLDEHVVARENGLAVEPHFRKRRQALETELRLLPRLAGVAAEPAAVPPVTRVEILRAIEIPRAPDLQRLRDRSRNRCLGPG